MRIRKAKLKLSLVIGITVALFLWNLSRTISDQEVRVNIEQRGNAIPSQHKREMLTDLALSKVDVPSKQRRDEKKFLIAFSYWEQLTQATNNLIQLTALAGHGGRRVVIPFVSDSQFYGTMISEQTQTLSLYYNVSELNRKLQFTGHGTLVSWKEFRDVCKDTLDVLINFHYSYEEAGIFTDSKAAFPCRAPHTSVFFHNLKVDTTTCIYASGFHSVEAFETEIAKRQPCVGIVEWRGNSYPGSSRAQFNFTSIVVRPLSFRAEDFFSVKLKHIAQDFIARNLRPDFISVHIRAESILYHGGDIDLVTKCMLELSSRARMMANTFGCKVYLATDFSEFGSSSRTVVSLKNKAKELIGILAKNLNPISFQPANYSLSDHGAIAIVEINILAAGKRLFVLGGGSFQAWIVEQFLKQNNNDLTLMNSTCKQI